MTRHSNSSACWQCGAPLLPDRPVPGSWCSGLCKGRYYRSKKTPAQLEAERAQARELRRDKSTVPSLVGEEWRPVAEFEGYEVSNRGRVKRLGGVRETPHYTGGEWWRPERLITGADDGRGYWRLSLTRDGKVYHPRVHRLVCAAFHGPCPPGKEQVRHLNGNPSDNRAENIMWGTSLENSADTRRHGNLWNLRKTHCKYGHEFTPENTRIISRTGYRACIECGRRTSREWQREKRKREAA